MSDDLIFSSISVRTVDDGESSIGRLEIWKVELVRDRVFIFGERIVGMV